MAKDGKQVEKTGKSGTVDAFLQQVAAMPTVKPAETRGRLLFAMDATASREPTWDRAAHIQASMFRETGALGGLEVQLCHYRGFRELHVSPWYADSDELLARMTRVRCAPGLQEYNKLNPAPKIANNSFRRVYFPARKMKGGLTENQTQCRLEWDKAPYGRVYRTTRTVGFRSCGRGTPEGGRGRGK